MVVERLDERSYEIETADGSTYRRNRIHLRKNNEPPHEETVSEPLRTPIAFGVDPYWTATSTKLLWQVWWLIPCEKSFARDPPHSEPYEETQESTAEVRTRSGWLVTWPSYLKDFVTWYTLRALTEDSELWTDLLMSRVLLFISIHISLVVVISYIVEDVTGCVTYSYLSNTYLDIPGCAKRFFSFPPFKDDLLFITRSPFFSCLLSALWHIEC